jgi:TPR repeat protein
MRNSTRILIVLWLGGSMPAAAWADPYKDALAAFTSGDNAGALRLLEGPAAQGNADAQELLGFIYANGFGGLTKYAEALRWFRLAAAQGNAKAQYDLGEMYYLGHGVTEDDAEALRWYRLASAQAHKNGDHDVADEADKAIAELTQGN